MHVVAQFSVSLLMMPSFLPLWLVPFIHGSGWSLAVLNICLFVCIYIHPVPNNTNAFHTFCSLPLSPMAIYVF